MDQQKTGRFIAQRRKEKNLTQMQLAEILGITDRAVSKWENGRSLPDSSIMLDLCRELGITVNDLLNGEVISMENYNKETEKKLLEMVREKEAGDKRLLRMEWVIGGLSLAVILIPCIIASYLEMSDTARLAVTFSGFIPAITGFLVALKIEQTAGYYECQACSHRYVPTFRAVNSAMHMGRTRYMKCPECGKRTWQKKVISKE